MIGKTTRKKEDSQLAHYHFLIANKENNSVEHVVFYRCLDLSATTAMKNIVSKDEEFVLWEKHILTFPEIIKLFFITMAIVSRGVVQMTNQERRDHGFGFKCDYSYRRFKA